MAISRCLEHVEEKFLDLLEWSRGAASDELYRAMVTVKVARYGQKRIQNY